MPTEDWMLEQLSEQQAAITNAELAILEGRYTGPDSLEAWCLALDPSLQGRLHPRIPLFELPETPPADVEVPDVVWKGSPNFWTGHGGYEVCALVLHTMAGTLAGCTSWFAQSRSQVSSHYGIGLDGQIHQYVSLSDSSWANGVLEPGNGWPGPKGSPNWQTITIETEDKGNPEGVPVTDAMYDAVLEVATLAKHTFPSIKWLLGHNDISPSSRSRCPGPRWRAELFDDLADELGLATL